MPIDKVYCGVSTTEDLLTAVNALIDQGESNLGTIQQLLTDLSSLESQVGQIEIDLGNEVTRLDGDISSLEATLTGLINANTAAIQSNDNDIAGLRTDTDANTSAIQSNDNDIAGLRTDVDTLYPWAMRKVEFESRRAENNEKFAASGFVHFGKEYAAAPENVINQGMYANPASAVPERAKVLHLGRNEALQTGKSKTDYPFINISGVVTKLLGADKEYYTGAWDRDSFIVQFPPAEDGTRTYDSATGESVTHATPAIAFASETDTNKVVTDRVDMWGFEAFLREINDADPFVYKNGLIQSLATDINGVSTVTDNVRPDTYFAWYEGDTTSRGRGVNWQTASEANRIKIASDPANNIYLDDATGKFYQWCVRGRSFAGVDNGDWYGLTSVGVTGLQFGKLDPTKSYVQTQGTQNDVDSYTSGFNNGGHVYVSDSTIWSTVTVGDVGIFKGSSSTTGTTDRAVNGECYFLVCGTVSRLNQGAYHPSLNPLGTRSFFNSDGTQSAEQSWDHPSSKRATSKAQCFDIAYNGNTVGNSSPFVFSGSGRLLSTNRYRQRPDGRVYDAIYASGQGGVCRDMRYSAWGLTQEDFAEADLKVKSEEYRGAEKILRTRISPSTNTTDIQNIGPSKLRVNVKSMFGILPADREKIKSLYIEESTGFTGSFLTITKTDIDSRFVDITFKDPHNYVNGGDVGELVVAEIETSLPVAGGYTHTEVIGDPANILQCDDLKDGWVGGWNPGLPEAGISVELTKPCEGSQISYSQTDDNGDSWATGTRTVDAVTNIANLSPSVGTVTIINYAAKAKVTEDTNNYEIYGGDLGIGSVYACCWGGATSRGKGLGYSLISKVAIGRDSYKRAMTYPITQGSVDASLGKFPASTSYPIKHKTVDLEGEDSPAFKALNYNVVDNQQGFINYAYTELHYDTTAGDWGDDGKIHIADNQTTMIDENGYTVLVGTARCVEPLGWIKNDK